MNKNEVVAKFEKGVLVSINETLAPLVIKTTHSIEKFLELRVIDMSRTNARILKKVLNMDFDDDYKEINNYSIVNYNKQIEKLCESLNINYLDVFSQLSVNNQLNEEYTDDGVFLNDNGYKRLYKIIRKIVDDEK